MITPVVLLNGPPSSGKTTLAEALQSASPVPFFHLSLDDFRGDVRSDGVCCPLEVAQEWERQRTDRLRGPVELDVPEFDDVHRHRYDLEVHTATTPTDESVRRLRAVIDRRFPELGRADHDETI